MAQTAGILDGTIIIFKSGGATIAHSTNFSLNETASTRNITTKDTAAGTEHVAQRTESTISIEGMVAYDAAEGYIDAQADLTALTSVAATWGSFIVGDELYTATVYLTSVNMTADLDDNITYSIEGVVSGAITVSQSV